MVETLKSRLKKYPMVITLAKKAVAAKAAISAQVPRALSWNDTRILESLPMFAPASAGSRKDLARLTLKAAKDTFPLIIDLISIGGKQIGQPVPIETFMDTDGKRAAAARLKELFDHFGSDKAIVHYHCFYGSILSDVNAVTNFLEVGLGTNNPHVASNMGRKGRPGASLRAFRDFLPNANIYGADIDRAILFEEPRIKTFFVDQTDLSTFEQLSSHVADELDLIIDDGLHSPNANIGTLLFGIKRLKVGGWLVVEDIPYQALPVWQVVATLLPENFEPYLVSARWDLLFAVRRSG